MDQRGWSSGWKVMASGEKEKSWKASAGMQHFRASVNEEYRHICKLT